MPESFGARLRRTREEQQIALGTIAHQTKIKMSLLDGLERDDVSHWPSGIFRRAYVRAYAQAIGLDPDAVVNEFLQVHPEPQVAIENALAAALAADAARANSGSTMRLRNFVGSALGSLSRLRRPSAEELEQIGETPVESARPQDDGPIEDGPLEIGSATFLSQPTPELVALESAPERVTLDRADDAGFDNDETPESVMPEGLPFCEEVAVAGQPAEPAEVWNPAPAPAGPDWAGLAQLCTGLGRAETLDDLNLSLQQAAELLDATGLIVWIWDERSKRLQPALAHGYSDKVLAQLPALTAESDNATAAAFRSAQICAINATPDASGALAVPLQTASGPSGVLALELLRGGEARDSVRAAATIIAALFARLVDRPDPAAIEAEERERAAEMEARAAEAQARAAEMEAFKSAVRRVHARR